MPEFAIIKKYFQTPATKDHDVIMGIGDDAAILTVPANQQLVVCVDTIVQGQHFLADTPAAEIGYRALAVNLSDIAAMGAVPKWFTLALTLPQADEQWLSEFSRGLFTLAQEYQLHLIGGDTTQGPLAISVQIMGVVPPGQALLRSGARVGDKIYVSGYLGDAGLGLAMLQHQILVASPYQEYLRQRYQHPVPRLALGSSLRGIASSAIDISDGLAGDLSHILEQSNVGAKITIKDVPLSAALRATVDLNQAYHYALTAGDDYELCFTVPVEKEAQVQEIANNCGIVCTCIGEIVADQGLKIMAENGSLMHLSKLGWECL